jgi:hypothetical protein
VKLNGRAFTKFDAYQLAKYDSDRVGVKLRDVLFLCHAKPKDAELAPVWKKLVENTLESPDTWEVALSAGKASARTSNGCCAKASSAAWRCCARRPRSFASRPSPTHASNCRRGVDSRCWSERIVDYIAAVEGEAAA